MSKPQSRKPLRLALTQKMVILTGLSVLALLIALPISDAAILMRDFNYVFWSGQTLPITVIVLLICVIVLYFFVAGGIRMQGTQDYSVQSLATLASTFCTVLGLILLLASLIMFYREESVHSALTYSCPGSPVTRDVRTWYLSLLALRRTPQCAKLFSVVECHGFASAAPPAYSAYLRSLEDTYHCSGFCYAPAQGNASLVELGNAVESSNRGVRTPSDAGPQPPAFLAKGSAADQADSSSAVRTPRPASLPPALFSPGRHKSSCDGAAARNLAYLAISTSKLWWWMGIALVGLSAVVSFGELVRKAI